MSMLLSRHRYDGIRHFHLRTQAARDEAAHGGNQPSGALGQGGGVTSVGSLPRDRAGSTDSAQFDVLVFKDDPPRSPSRSNS